MKHLLVYYAWTICLWVSPPKIEWKWNMKYYQRIYRLPLWLQPSVVTRPMYIYIYIYTYRCYWQSTMVTNHICKATWHLKCCWQYIILIGPLGKEVSQIRINIQQLSWQKMSMNFTYDTKWRLFCFARNVMTATTIQDKPLTLRPLVVSYRLILPLSCRVASYWTGPLFTKMTPFDLYRDSHYKTETTIRSSDIYNGDSNTRNTSFFSE